MAESTLVYIGESLAAYGFGNEHPFGTDRLVAFWSEVQRRGLERRVQVLSPKQANETDLLRFHTLAYLDLVKRYSSTGEGFLDTGDTPIYRYVRGCGDCGRMCS